MTISDPRGLEVCCHGGGQSAAVDLLPGDDHRDHRHPDGRPPHIRVRGPGQDHRHLPRQVDAGTASDTLLHHTAATTCHVDTYRETVVSNSYSAKPRSNIVVWFWSVGGGHDDETRLLFEQKLLCGFVCPIYKKAKHETLDQFQIQMTTLV